MGDGRGGESVAAGRVLRTSGERTSISTAAAGPSEAPARIPAERIIDPGRPGVEGLYGPDSEAWRLNREAVMLLIAGPRALLLQVAHPLVAEGVDQHSDFREDPWRRLQGTIASYLRLVYGTREEGLAEIGRLNALHRAITGPIRAGAETPGFDGTYSARDPALALWVHATLVDSTLVAYEALVEPLTAARRERYYAETRPIARLFGIADADVPADLEAFDAYLEWAVGPDGPVHPTGTSRDIAWHILHPPFGPLHPALRWIPRRAATWTMWPAVGLLPRTTRDEYELRWSPTQEAVSAWLTAAWRWWARRLPSAFRQMTRARRADRRVAALSARPGSGSNGR